MPTQEPTIIASELFVPEFNDYLKTLAPKERSIMTFAVFQNPYAPNDINDPKTLPILLYIGGLTQGQFVMIRGFGLGSTEETDIVEAIILTMNGIKNIKKDEEDINDRLELCTLPFTKSSSMYLSGLVNTLEKKKSVKQISQCCADYVDTLIDYMCKHRIFK